MLKKIGKNKVKFLFALITVVLFTSELAFARKKSDLVKEESGFYYGYGKASSKEEAIFMAKRDLIENALTATVRLTDPAASDVSISDEAVEVRLADEKPYEESKDGLTVTFRMRVSEWERNEKDYAEKLREKLGQKYNSFVSSTDVSKKLELASSILTTLAENGVSDTLTIQEKGTELYSRKVESVCSVVLQNIEFTASKKDSILNSKEKITVSVKDKNGKAISNMLVKAVWEAPYESIISETVDVSEVVSVLSTDSSGNVVVEYPSDEEYKNRVVTLTVSSAIATGKFVTTQMRVLDGECASDLRFYCIDDFDAIYSSVDVKAGEFTAGAVAHDSRANVREESRKVKLGDYSIDVTPVTNFKYKVYLYLTRSDVIPEYIENPDYCLPEQPIIGVTVEDAEKYAKWLSEQSGYNYRLPTDDEWEKAARAGYDVIYPWGDDNPSEEKKANYKGNGKIKGPSPVGTFTSGTNAWGLVDMAGNVWEWTSSARDLGESSTKRTVKGGSWMDGPIDLRISNYKNIEGSRVYPDVGFRLIKEK